MLGFVLVLGLVGFMAVFCPDLEARLGSEAWCTR